MLGLESEERQTLFFTMLNQRSTGILLTTLAPLLFIMRSSYNYLRMLPRAELNTVILKMNVLAQLSELDSQVKYDV